MDPSRPSYQHVAWCYEAIARVYSGGAIAAAKASQLSELRNGDRVLYVGVGSGEDALLAAGRELQVSGLDVSPGMLKRLERRLELRGLDAELLCEDLFGHERFGGYDAVAANFVLNVFPEALMLEALSHLVRLLKPGGCLLLADFAPPRGNVGQRALAHLYYRPVNLAAWALRLCSLHPIYDYSGPCEALGLSVRSRQRFPIFGRGPRLFESWVAQLPS